MAGCKYPGSTWFVLIGMIVTGAGRSIAVKLAYQSGFNAPLTITLLYLFGQSLSLILYGFQKWWEDNNGYVLPSATKDGGGSPRQHGKQPETGTYVIFDDADKRIRPATAGAPPDGNSPRNLSIETDARHDIEAHADGQNCDSNAAHAKPIAVTRRMSSLSVSGSPSSASTVSSPSSIISCAVFEFLTACSSEADDKSIGSTHGLSRQSKEQIKWVHRVPFFVKPAIPAVLNLLNSALRWSSLVYVDASVAEMMTAGLELTFGVIAARIFRRRMVATSRWVGIAIVTAGVIIIERANNTKAKTSEGGDEEGVDSFYSTSEVTIGVCLIVLQSILSALQDIGEEIFMQATNFPATAMLGMEGLYGFCIGSVIYFAFGDRLRLEDVDATRSMLADDARMRWWLVGLPFLFLLTGVFNIKATEVTSAMTRNVWKNFRTVLVWATALGCFYLGDNPAYGESWQTPESFVILLGFTVMGGGIIVYYWFKEQEQSKALLAKDNVA